MIAACLILASMCCAMIAIAVSMFGIESKMEDIEKLLLLMDAVASDRHGSTDRHLDHVQGDINMLRMRHAFPSSLSESELKIKLGIQSREDADEVLAGRKARWEEKHGQG